MSVRVFWDNKHRTAIRYDFTVVWEWEEFYAAVDIAYAMTSSVEHTVDTISNFRVGVVLPQNALFEFRQVMVNAPKNRGINVIIVRTKAVKDAISMFTKFDTQLGARLLVASTLYEAREMLAERRK